MVNYFPFNLKNKAKLLSRYMHPPTDIADIAGLLPIWPHNLEMEKLDAKLMFLQVTERVTLALKTECYHTSEGKSFSCYFHVLPSNQIKGNIFNVFYTSQSCHSLGQS